MSLRARRVDAAVVYLAYVAADGFIRGLLYTVLAVYFVLRVGMDPFQLVLIGTILEASCFLFEIPTGVLADVYSRRLSIVVGETLFGLAYVVQGSVPLFPVVAAVEVLRAIGETCLSGALQAWVGGEVARERLPRLLVRGVHTRRVGRLLGIAASAVLANVALELPIVAGGVLALVVAIALAALMPERAFAARSGPSRSAFDTARLGIAAVGRHRVLLVLLGLALVLGAASEGVDRLWEAHLLTNFTIPPFGSLSPVTWFGVLEAGGLVIGILAMQVVVRFQTLDVTRIARYTAVAIIARSCAIGVLALTGSWPVAVVARWTQVGLSGVTGPRIDAWIVRNTPDDVRATVFSTLSQGDALGQAFGGPVLGVIATWVSLRAAILASALMLLPGVGLLRLAPARQRDRTSGELVSVQ